VQGLAEAQWSQSSSNAPKSAGVAARPSLGPQHMLPNIAGAGAQKERKRAHFACSTKAAVSWFQSGLVISLIARVRMK